MQLYTFSLCTCRGGHLTQGGGQIGDQGEGRETSNPHENMATSGHVTPDIWSNPEGEGNEIIRLSYRILSNSNHPSCAGDQSVFVLLVLV